VPSVGDNLLTYLSSRLSASYTGLDCASYGLKDTVRLITNSNGVATGVVLTVDTQKPVGSASEPGTSLTQVTARTRSEGPTSWG
jgi:hypothetical protein